MAFISCWWVCLWNSLYRDFGGRLRWQSDFVLWRVDVFKRAYWGQWRTEIWLGHVYACWLWPFGFYR